MGIFSKDPAKAADRQAKLDTKAQEESDKARAKAMKRGVSVEGAVAVGHTFDNSADQFLVVFPGRVDLVNMGKAGSLLRSGAGTETIPVNRISSAECRNKGIWTVVEVHTSDNSIEFKADQVSGPYLRQMILDQVNAGGAASSATPSVDVTDQLRKLGELHQAGILTDEEFAAKKSELLRRL